MPSQSPVIATLEEFLLSLYQIVKEQSLKSPQTYKNIVLYTI